MKGLMDPGFEAQPGSMKSESAGARLPRGLPRGKRANTNAYYPEDQRSRPQAGGGLQSAVTGRKKRMLGRAGAVLLLLIIPVKLMRLASAPGPVTDLAPSVLGPAGLFLMSLSLPGKPQVLIKGLLTCAFSMILELVQMLPRPGILAKIHYTFDTCDLIASILSVAVSAAAAWMFLESGNGQPSGDRER